MSHDDDDEDENGGKMRTGLAWHDGMRVLILIANSIFGLLNQLLADCKRSYLAPLTQS
ncbi:hypothetical protein GBA52_025635 [Prunus armeniaca]|nr:hypothetical protein GBA52_025635 [Prunus armeniaca]